MHDKRYNMIWYNPESLIGGNILVSILIDISKWHLSSLYYVILLALYSYDLLSLCDWDSAHWRWGDDIKWKREAL